MRSIELLSPARNLECAIEAIRHGADAVYIGAERFGARAAAGNSVEDITALVRYAHVFGVRVYITLNTLLYKEELSAVDDLIGALQQAGVDALIVQDPQLVALNRGRIALHASTQMDNRTMEDVRARQQAGYEQTVLARELSLEDIRAIHEAVPSMPLEVFIHGALCVSYSGRCYASEYCFGRSANRGECAQFCRLPFDLVDADGCLVTDAQGERQHQRHLLSLKDMNRSADLEALMDAGVSSFKIEGRLKDVTYVKNITAYYRQLIDQILSRRSADYRRASAGTVSFSFTPNPLKSFNRGFTSYYLHGRTAAPVFQPLTPKSLGEPVGHVKDIRYGQHLSVAGTAAFSAGDGLCFFAADGHLQGFRVNRVDNQGYLYPADHAVLQLLRRGMPLYRNADAAFERVLAHPSAERRLQVWWRLDAMAGDAEGFRLTLTDELQRSVSQTFPYAHEPARAPQRAPITRQLLRLGDTPFACAESQVEITYTENWFIPASVLADWRRTLCEQLLASTTPSLAEHLDTTPDTTSVAPTTVTMPDDVPLMTCRHCLRFAMGYCPRTGAKVAVPRFPWSLRLSDGRTFPLRFDCQACEMQVMRLVES